MRLLLLLTLIVFETGLFAQVKTVYISGQNLSSHFRLSPDNNKSESKIYGSPYADEHWTAGTVSFKNIEGLVADHLRLNAWTDELEIFNKGNKMAVTQPFMIENLKVGNREYIYSLYKYFVGKSEYVSSSYFQLIDTGNIDLLKRYYIKIVNNSYVSNYMGGGGDGRNYYNLRSEYFYRTGDNKTARPLPGKKKELLDLLKIRRAEIEVYIKTSNFRISSDEDIELLIKFYNSL